MNLLFLFCFSSPSYRVYYYLISRTVVTLAHTGVKGGELKVLWKLVTEICLWSQRSLKLVLCHAFLPQSFLLSCAVLGQNLMSHGCCNVTGFECYPKTWNFFFSILKELLKFWKFYSMVASSLKLLGAVEIFVTFGSWQNRIVVWKSGVIGKYPHLF